MFTTRTLLEARGPILVLLSLAILGAFWSLLAAAVPVALLVLVLVFFRDPTRRVPDDPDAVVSPADGTIVEITPVREEIFLGSDATRVSVFLSILDVHVQRAPVQGTIRLVRRESGRYLDARDPRSGSANESRAIGIESMDGFRLLVRQIAGKIARRIVGWEEAGAALAKGQRVGMIRFGSRVELYLPPGTDIAVRPGEHVKGGETIIARRR
jgi:phosphatidylserine decarboxylase